VTTATLTYSAPTAIATALSTELDGLVSAAYSAASGVIDNSSTKYLYMALELTLASLTPGAANTGVSVFLLPAVNTAYPDGGGAVAPAAENFLCAFATLSTSAGAKVRTIGCVPIPPFAFKLVVLNGAGVNFAANTNTLKYKLYSEQSA
jgi:hypothetical protein